jgi:peroxiredoxin
MTSGVLLKTTLKKMNKMKTIVMATAALITMSFSMMAPAGLKPGDAATDFKLLNIDSSMIGLSSYKQASKGAIVIFKCNHCPFSIAYEDRIIALHEKYAVKGYPVIAINPNDAVQYPSDGFSEMQVRAKEKGFKFPYLHDETQAVAKAWGAERTPHVFVVKKEKKKWMVKFVGAIDNNTDDAAAADKKYTEMAVDALLAGKEPEIKSVKAIGCGVKWKKAK